MRRTASSTSSLLDLESGTVTATSPTTTLFDGAPGLLAGRPARWSSSPSSATATPSSSASTSPTPASRFQLTSGESNENDPVYSPDGKRVYFTSDRDGAENIYSLDLATGELRQYTNVVTGAFMPTVLRAAPTARSAWSTPATGRGASTSTSPTSSEPVEDADDRRAAPSSRSSPRTCRASSPTSRSPSTTPTRSDYGGFKFFLEDAESLRRRRRRPDLRRPASC